MAIGNRVKVIYITNTAQLPDNKDPDAIYFVKKAKQIWVGDDLMADSVDLPDMQTILAPYKVKDIAVQGKGFVSSIILNSDGVLTFNKTPSAVSKQVDVVLPTATLQAGQTINTITDINVSGSSIQNEITPFKLPPQITDVKLAKSASGVFNVNLTTSDDGVATTKENIIPPEFIDGMIKVSRFASAEQGVKADGAMQSVGGTATSAKVTLTGDPVNPLDAVTKQYVDSIKSIATSAMHLLGTSSTLITNNGTEAPTISSAVKPIAELKNGDIVTYGSIEFMWDGDKWTQLGDESSFAYKERKITVGDGLVGGGTLVSDMTISHKAVTASETLNNMEDGEIKTFTSAVIDKMGHITTSTFEDVTPKVNTLIDTKVNPVIARVTACETADTRIEGKADKVIQDLSTTNADVDSIRTVAQSADTKADSLQTQVTAVKTTADSAKQLAEANKDEIDDLKLATDNQVAVDTANEAKTLATDAKNLSTTASNKATTALNTANTASSNASEAKTLSLSAATTANQAQVDASSALSSVKVAETAAIEARDAASSAETDAQSATTLANDALTRVTSNTTALNDLTDRVQPIHLGGTAGTTIAKARSNLQVYSKDEIEPKFANIAKPRVSIMSTASSSAFNKGILLQSNYGTLQLFSSNADIHLQGATGLLAKAFGDAALKSVNGEARLEGGTRTVMYSTNEVKATGNAVATVSSGEYLLQATPSEIKIANGAAAYYVNSGGVGNYSDRAFKTDIDYDLTDDLSKFHLLKPVSYKGIGSSKATRGIIAQDVEKVYPDLVDKNIDDKDHMGLQYNAIFSIAVAKIQEQDKSINTLKTNLNNANAEIALLKNEILEIKAKLNTEPSV